MSFVIPMIRSGQFFERIFLQAVKNVGFIETTERGMNYSIRKADQEEESKKIDYFITFEEGLVVPIQITISLNSRTKDLGPKIAMLKRGEIALFWPALSPDSVYEKKQHLFQTTLEAANANVGALEEFIRMLRRACEQYLGCELIFPPADYAQLQICKSWGWIKIEDFRLIKQALGRGSIRKRINGLLRNSNSQEECLEKTREILRNLDPLQFWIVPA